jgi:Protein of unknown function (DUF2889)
MPLSPAAPREHIHTRSIDCRGYRRADGLWDIDGYLTDTKTNGFSNHFRGELPPGAPVHDMWLRLTVDDKLVIHAVEAGPYDVCPSIAPNFQRLSGSGSIPASTSRCAIAWAASRAAPIWSTCWGRWRRPRIRQYFPTAPERTRSAWHAVKQRRDR